MEITKKVNLGEYIVIINYNDTTGSIKVTILDELEDEIEHIEVTSDEDNDEINPTLN